MHEKLRKTRVRTTDIDTIEELKEKQSARNKVENLRNMKITFDVINNMDYSEINLKDYEADNFKPEDIINGDEHYD